MDKRKQGMGLEEAALSFLACLSPEERGGNQQEINKFVLWYGRERLIAELTAPEIASYAEWMATSVADVAKKLTPIRAFLAYAQKEGWIKTNLTVHLRVKKGLPKAVPPAKQRRGKPLVLTSSGYARLEVKLGALKKERPHLAEELRQAAADKDFRENAPLEAAREHREQVESRIGEIETALKAAEVISEGQEDTLEIGLSSTVVLRDLSSEEQLSYTLVDPYQSDPTRGKLSIASPIGKALLHRKEGEVVEIAVPSGKLRYQIERVECQAFKSK